jgi:alkylation response protein AidB-like acyl-CoA dehydrogenase
MLDFSFTEEQEMIKNMVHDFGHKELAPGYAERVRNETIPPELIKKMAALGLLGLNIPEEYGGEVKDVVTVGIILEELARHADDGAWLAFNSYALADILKLGTDEIKDEWLKGMVTGDRLVLMGATEAEAGSDLANLKATARKDGEYYILNGEKNRVTGALIGHAVMVLARTDPDSRRITPFLVPFDLPGVSIARINDMGNESIIGGIVSSSR